MASAAMAKATRRPWQLQRRVAIPAISTRDGSRSQRRAEQAALTEYEKQRIQNMMRNNRIMQQLDVKSLDTLLRQTSQRKAKARKYCLTKRKQGDKVSDNILPDTSLTPKSLQSGGTRSKRVMASEVLVQPARLTRQRTRELEASEEDVQRSTIEFPQDVNPDAYAQLNEQICLPNAGEKNALVQRPRGTSMGKGLSKLIQGLNSKMPLRVAEGKKRPEAPFQAAKLASEAGIIVRQHISVFPHWKECKKSKNSAQLTEFMGKVSGKFNIDPDNEPVVAACTDLMKSGLRQFRYRLKKKYFDGVPANEVPTTSPVRSISNDQWRALVERWSLTKHKNQCEANKRNREKVLLHHTTGSRCYTAHGHVLKQLEKYKDSPPTPIDLFKDFYCSSKTGFTEPVKVLVAQMEAILDKPVEEGHVSKTPTEIVAQVLPPKNKFLQNAGFEPALAKKIDKAAAARVQELEAELKTKEQNEHALKDEVASLKEKVSNSDKAIEKLMKTSEETQSLLRLMVSLRSNNEA